MKARIFNRVGWESIAKFLKENHKDSDKFIDDRTVCDAFFSTIIIEAGATKSGRKEIFTIPDAGYDTLP